MSQAMTVKIKLEPNKKQLELIQQSSRLYIDTVNTLVAEMVEVQTQSKKTTKHIHVPLNSSVKNQAIRDAKSVFKRAKKTQYQKIPVLKRPIIVWNNQNYTINHTSISVPFIVKGKSKRIEIKAHISDYERNVIEKAGKLGTLRITRKGTDYVAQIAVETPVKQPAGIKTMGVDLGVKIPAVCCTDDHKVKCVGNGRENKYIRRKHNTRRKKLGKAKKLNAIKKSRNKEQRWMNDKDHKASREIVDFAIQHNVGIIKLEKLANIRKQTSKSRKNNHSLSNWSFYRLTKYIEYKANLAGIKVEYVDPKYTSQQCPKCGHKNKAKDREYKCCNCGYKSHRDIVGAENIIHAPVLDGNSQVA
ncbi:transposase [Staphylococcus sp. IVB6181]|uniref:RNA-guided endonuclease InsQ/TnpB family protein n=1 Tax=Staphylococcus sp. IVB6181 TaxID=2929481 RepID=UPI0021D130C1|nr:transposase [Staphylococcus sp. IVB6181]UXV34879.1 transposase [Staphylococcus sp. IVB6181]